MDISLYFSPLSLSKDDFFKEQLGGLVSIHNDQDGFPDWENAELIIMSVDEERASINNDGCGKGAAKIRQQLYQLFSGAIPNTVDLGTILPGETIQDTYYAIQSCMDVLIKKGKTVIFLGGSQDLTVPIYRGYENTEQLVNLTTIDHRFDIGESSDSEMNSESYLSDILLHQPNFLFNYSNIGYQTYFSSPDIIQLMDKLFFDKIRLGEVRMNIRDTEPLIRNTDILSFDVASIQAADMAGCNRSTPNGLLPDEACQLTRYAGLSDKVSCFGVFEYNGDLDESGRSAMLVAEMIWYFMEGFSSRKLEMPRSNDQNFLKYRVPVEGSEEDLIFFKSIRTDRWWMNVPYPEVKSNKFRRLHMVPCSYQDYLVAGQDDLPDLWVKTYRKFL